VLLQCFNNIPGLTFHDGDLTCEHALLKVSVLLEDSAECYLSLAPPGGGSKKRKEVVSCFLREGLSYQRDGQEKPAERKAPPLRWKIRIRTMELNNRTYSIRMFPGP
jgi:hypothetical protein